MLCVKHSEGPEGASGYWRRRGLVKTVLALFTLQVSFRFVGIGSNDNEQLRFHANNRLLWRTQAKASGFSNNGWQKGHTEVGRTIRSRFSTHGGSTDATIHTPCQNSIKLLFASDTNQGILDEAWVFTKVEVTGVMPSVVLFLLPSTPYTKYISPRLHSCPRR